MDLTTVIAVCGMVLSVGINVALVAKWSGKTSAQITAIQDDIKRLEGKQDKHNCLIERMVAVEASSKSAHHRIDEIVDEHGAWIDKK